MRRYSSFLAFKSSRLGNLSLSLYNGGGETDGQERGFDNRATIIRMVSIGIERPLIWRRKVWPLHAASSHPAAGQSSLRILVRQLEMINPMTETKTKLSHEGGTAPRYYSSTGVDCGAGGRLIGAYGSDSTAVIKLVRREQKERRRLL